MSGNMGRYMEESGAKSTQEFVTKEDHYRTSIMEWPKVLGQKVILLGKKNLEKLRGYKADLRYNEARELIITITGLTTQKATKDLYDSIKKLSADEITEKPNTRKYK